jgi:hypothetical protein
MLEEDEKVQQLEQQGDKISIAMQELKQRKKAISITE